MGIFNIFRKRKTSGQVLGSEPRKPSIDLNVNFSVSVSKPLTQAKFDATIVPVEKRIKTAIASNRGLYPHEILLLSYAHTFYTDENSFQKFWWTSYGIRDVKAIICSLQERGFLRISDLRETLNRQTVADVKELLKANGKKTTGKKAELAQRVLDELSETEAISRFPKRTYSLTEVGEVELAESAYIPYIHRKSFEDLDIWSLNRMVNKKPPMPYQDRIWEHLNKRSTRYISDNDFGLYRNCRFHMAQFLMDEQKYIDALSMLAEVVFCDLSGASNGYKPEILEKYAASLFPYESSLARTAPGIIRAIGDCQNELQFSDDELVATLTEQMSKLSMPLQLFTIEECVQIVMWEREQKTQELENMYNSAKKVFKQKHPKCKL